jgi:histone H3/H4
MMCDDQSQHMFEACGFISSFQKNQMTEESPSKRLKETSPTADSAAVVVEEEQEEDLISSPAPASGAAPPLHDFEVPASAIAKILKVALPEGAVCTKDARSAFSKAAGIFVLYITSCANDLARASKRSTINSQDIMTSLQELGYASFIPHLEATLEKMKHESEVRKAQKSLPAEKKRKYHIPPPAATTSTTTPSPLPSPPK